MLLILSGCTESDSLAGDNWEDDPSVIHIGGIQNTEVETSLGGYTTSANGENNPVDAETVDWLLGPLFGGLDITYGAKDKPDTKNVAILKLLKLNPESSDISNSNIKYSQYEGPNGEKLAEYSFNYRNPDGSEGGPAKWYDNGPHFFQGVFVPSELRYTAGAETASKVNDPTSGTAKSLLTDQSKEGGNDNYTLLARYLGMPADATINATVGRIKLPFRHRLARVLTYVLIDPSMGSNVTIKGYAKDANGRDDASTSEIKFCNVDVLAGVKETVNSSQHAELTPQWKEKERKVIPHFLEERASVNSLGTVVDAENFIMFYNTDLKTYIFPANDDKWIEARNAWNEKYGEATGTEEDKIAYADANSGYERTLYGIVPCYDLIVRPTYSSSDMVMYDEELSGSTDAELAASRAELAEKKNNIDFELTLNNGLEYYKNFQFDLDANYQTIVYLRINRESIDYNSSGAEPWTEERNDDGYYGVNNQNGNTLSFAGSSWQRAYRFASKDWLITDGHYYGKDDTTDADNVQDDDQMPWYPQYVSQTQWVKMFAEAREGGLHHGDYFILDSDITIDAKLLPADFVFTGHLDGQDHTITLTGMGEKVVDEAAWDEDHYVGATSDDYSETLYVLNGINYDVFSIPNPLYVLIPATYYEEGDDIPEGKKVGDVKEQEHYDVSNPASVSVLMSGNYYIKNSDDTYSPYNPTLYVNKPIHHPEISHTSGSTLFAGLNGAYAAAIGEANVHLENGVYVPYVDTLTGTGWRAEVINTKIKGTGTDMFPESVVKADDTYDVTKVSGYIYNCWKIADDNRAEKIKSHTPTLPKYK